MVSGARSYLLRSGEPAPWFRARCTNNPRYNFASAAGRYLVLLFFQSAASAASRQLIDALMECHDLFDDSRAAIFGLSVDPADERERRVKQRIPGCRFFWDFDGTVSRLYGALPDPVTTDLLGPGYRRHLLLLDPMLRVVSVHLLGESPGSVVERLRHEIPSQTNPAGECPGPSHAPVLVLPRIFEKSLCRRLIEHYEAIGGSDSGYMIERNGLTVGRIDHKVKRRFDAEIQDEKLRDACMVRIHDRLLPLLSRCFQIEAKHMERYIVACYDSTTGGYFRPHRDNGSKGTAHRQFAVTLNLNSEDFEGGSLRFPEFGPALYKPPTGGAVVFSCALLHEATPVTRGRRFAFLPFLYDAEHARIRRANCKYISTRVDLPDEESGIT